MGEGMLAQKLEENLERLSRGEPSAEGTPAEVQELLGTARYLLQVDCSAESAMRKALRARILQGGTATQEVTPPKSARSRIIPQRRADLSRRFGGWLAAAALVTVALVWAALQVFSGPVQGNDAATMTITAWATASATPMPSFQVTVFPSRVEPSSLQGAQQVPLAPLPGSGVK